MSWHAVSTEHVWWLHEHVNLAGVPGLSVTKSRETQEGPGLISTLAGADPDRIYARARALEEIDAIAKKSRIQGHEIVAFAIVSTHFYSDTEGARVRAFFVEREAYRAMRKLFAVLAKLSVEETRKEAA